MELLINLKSVVVTPNNKSFKFKRAFSTFSLPPVE